MENKDIFILGIFPNKNSSAALIKNGKLIAVGEEERFNRIKTTSNLPIKSIKYVLSEANLSLTDVDHIALAWDCSKYPEQMELFRKENLKGRSEIDELVDQIKTTNWNSKLIEFKLRTELKQELPPIHYVSHHLSHAASTYYLSGFNDSLILSVLIFPLK